MAFEILGLTPETLRAVDEAGYTEPTPIQRQAIPTVLMGRDIMGIAQTGTGKTASFTLPMIDILSQGRARARMPRSLILEPTRELAAQVAENFEVYGKYHKLNMALLIGGVSFSDQDAKLDRGVDVLIATPGRLLDHFERGKLMLNGVEVLVVDEADRMLDMGFIPDVERILKLMPQKHQSLLFSATMAPDIKRLADNFMTDPKLIEVAPPASPAENVEQFQIRCHPKDKRDVLRKLIRAEDVKNAIVFCNRKRDVDTLDKSLKTHGFNAAGLHGDMAQSHRMQVLEKFKSSDIQILVASDVAARGLDISAVSHVFNFDVPIHSDDYIHRIGRTGRAGRSGRAFMIVTREDGKYLDAIERMIGKKIPTFQLEGNAPVDEPDISESSTEDSKQERNKGQKKPPRNNRDKRDRSDRNDRRESKPEHTEDRKPPEARRDDTRRDDTRRDNSRRDDNAPPVKGLGDHVPAFLTSPGSSPAKSKPAMKAVAPEKAKKTAKATKAAVKKKTAKKPAKKAAKKTVKKAAKKKVAKAKAD